MEDFFQQIDGLENSDFAFTPSLAEDERGKPADLCDINSFMAADTPRKREKFADRFAPLFNYAFYQDRIVSDAAYDIWEYDSPESYQDAREPLITAIQAVNLINEISHDKTRVSDGDFAKLGLRFWDVSNSPVSNFPAGRFKVGKTENGIRRLASAEEVAAKAKRYGSDIREPYFEIETRSPAYADYLEKASELISLMGNLRHCRLYDMKEPKPRYVLFMGFNHSGVYSLKSTAGAKALLSDFVDSLFTLHLWDVATVCRNGREERTAGSALSSLWWIALDSFREGRVGLCSICGRPFIAKRERGQKRLYCSSACKSWSKANPGKVRIAK